MPVNLSGLAWTLRLLDKTVECHMQSATRITSHIAGEIRAGCRILLHHEHGRRQIPSARCRENKFKKATMISSRVRAYRSTDIRCPLSRRGVNSQTTRLIYSHAIDK